MVPPSVAADFATEGELGPDAGIIAGKEFDLFDVASVFEGEGAAAGAGELTGFDIHGDPLEAGAGKDFQGAAGAKRHFVKRAVGVAPDDAPDAGEGTFGAVEARPGLGRVSGRRDLQGVVFQVELELEFLADLLAVGGIELDDGAGGGVGVDGVGSASRAFESVGGEGGKAPIVRRDEENVFGFAIDLPCADEVGGRQRGRGDESGEDESGEGEQGKEQRLHAATMARGAEGGKAFFPEVRGQNFPDFGAAGGRMARMNPKLSFMTANFVARQLGYRMTEGWTQGEDATQAWFSPRETFAARFEEVLLEIKALGFDAIDLWAAHLHWRWATVGHIEEARRLLAQHELKLRSYAAWVPGELGNLRAACRFCVELGLPIIAGHIEAWGSRRAEAVAILREFGVRYAAENHPEKNAGEMLARVGEGDEDIAGIALDTGWCATQGWDPVAAVKELGPRLFAVHLKDVKPRRPEKTGLPFVDMGHETCRAGDGVVPVDAVLRELRAIDYRGPIAIEHEPEIFDPREEARESRERVERGWQAIEVRESAPPLRVAMVGCGNIAGAYGEAMRAYRQLEIAGATDLNRAAAEAWVSKNGGKLYSDLGDVLADPSVEAVVNLTIQQAHVDVVTRCLEAGKHVHSEKPLAPTYREARQLVELAEKRGVRLSCAPVTWLGEAQQTAWKRVREGTIGTPRVAYATVDWGRIETWHPNPTPFYAVGPVFDVGVYPLSLLTAWFGPVKKAIAGGGIVLPDRVTKDGQPFTTRTEDWIVAALEFAGGLRARLTANFYVGEPAEKRAGLEIHGDKGSIATEWFAATAEVRTGEFGGHYRRVFPVREPAGEGEWYCDWAAGLLELWRGLRTGKPHPTSGAHAAHVVEVMESVHRSVREGRAVELTSTFPAPEPLAWAK